MFWGTNPAESDNNLFWRTILEFGRSGNPLIVVDPRRTRTAAQATCWLAIRPGTDPYLALGMLNVILSEGWYRRDFVESWCRGFERLPELTAAYPPEVASEITGVEVKVLIEAARLYATHTPGRIGRVLYAEAMEDCFSDSWEPDRDHVLLCMQRGRFTTLAG